MSGMVDEAVGAESLRAAHAEVDALLTSDLTRSGADSLLDVWRELERLRSRLAAVEHRFVVEAESRALPFEYGAQNVAALMRGLLRVTPGEARARVRGADAAGARTGLSGEPVAAPFGVVAAAQRDGTVSPAHARVISRTIDQLPDAVQAEHGERLERDLVEYAAQFDPLQLAKLAARETAWLDPNGALSDVEYRDRQRDLTLCQRADGSASLRGEATAELSEYLLSLLDAKAGPAPADDGAPDPRRPGQRNHDALLDALKVLFRSEQVPDSGGVTTTVLLTMTRSEWETVQGFATTGHGAVLPAAEAIRIAGGEARVMNIVLDRAARAVGRAG